MKPNINPNSPDQPITDADDSTEAERVEIRARLLQTTTVLQALAHSRQWLDVLTVDERTALLKAAGDVFCVDPVLRRAQVKARRRESHHRRIARDEALLNGTGIRTQRNKPVFTTPDAYAPERFHPN